MNNRVRNTDETLKSSSTKKPIAASFESVVNAQTQPETQSETKMLIPERSCERIQQTLQGFHSRRHLIFRRPLSTSRSVDDLELEDMLVLKRANPIYDSDDEDEYQGSPPKRQKSKAFENEAESTASSVSWDEQLIEDEIRGFSLDSPTSSSSAIGAH
jgi:hypothetical protein